MSSCGGLDRAKGITGCFEYTGRAQVNVELEDYCAVLQYLVQLEWWMSVGKDGVAAVGEFMAGWLAKAFGITKGLGRPKA